MLEVSGSTGGRWSLGVGRESLIVLRWSFVAKYCREPAFERLAINDQRLLLSVCMDLFALTRRLIDIESITPNESVVGDFLCGELGRRGFESRRMPVEGLRANVLATWPQHARPKIVFSTHT